MTYAERIVEKLLETGEGDPNYQDDQLDLVVQALEAAGFPGAYYKEFDVYQGVFLNIPGVDKFWIEDRTAHEFVLTGDIAAGMDSRREEEDGIPHSCVVTFFHDEVDISDLLDYIQQYHGVKLANKAAMRSVQQFMRKRSLG